MVAPAPSDSPSDRTVGGTRAGVDSDGAELCLAAGAGSSGSGEDGGVAGVGWSGEGRATDSGCAATPIAASSIIENAKTQL